ncbi:MAG: metal-dependent transcriptional regulator, partial [Saprospiraceae bacterium]|nr:metal-dependent transcriptional regulator [Saprospiraceae bacterium]
EHIQSPTLVNKLDEYLSFPKFDPHGDPIPNEQGIIPGRTKALLAECEINTIVTFVEIKDSEPDFLKYLDQIGLQMGHQIEIKDRIDFDNSLRIQFDGHKIFISHIVANNIYVTKN